ncbi:trypsin-like peptidase domain-containing protein [Thermopolyspora sp. NPDC052614]|uniref:S1C family serine protease n=1 Tax=Thermopolyspora sp. NPDC052614 TaxID=3155682 RepID=UPI00344AFCCB
MTDENRTFGMEGAPVRAGSVQSSSPREDGPERLGRPEFFPPEGGTSITRVESSRVESHRRDADWGDPYDARQGSHGSHQGPREGFPPAPAEGHRQQHEPQPGPPQGGAFTRQPAPWEDSGGTRPISGPAGGPHPFGPPPPQQATGMGPGWAPPPTIPGGAVAGARNGPSTGLLVVIALVIALVAGGFGSIGTYVLTHDDASSTTDPSYSLGEAPTTGTVDRAPDSVAGVAARVLPSVVSLEVRGVREGGTGSGFIIQGGYIVTNNHVVAAAGPSGEITVNFNNGKSSPAKLVGADPSSDIAVVKPDQVFGMPVITLGNSDKVVVGDPVIAIGSPLGLTGTVTTGIVSALNRPVQAGGEGGSDFAWINAIQTDAAINPGNSGGPLVNASGQVIGVNSAIASLGSSAQSGSIGLGFSIPSNQVRRIAQELITTGVAKTSRIGISIDTSYTGDGVRIATQANPGQEAVESGGPADKAGLKPGDVIVGIDGKPVISGDQLIVTIRSKAPGDKIKVTYRRDGEEKTTTVTVGSAPAPRPQPS